MFLEFAAASISLGFLVFLINKTEFIYEYGKLLWDFSSYLKWKEANDGGFPVYIRENYDSFFSRMFGCPYCLITFSSVFVHLVFSSVFLFLAGAFVSTVVWGLCTLLYFAVNKNYQ
jgi:hypothetical protein